MFSPVYKNKLRDISSVSVNPNSFRVINSCAPTDSHNVFNLIVQIFLKTLIGLIETVHLVIFQKLYQLWISSRGIRFWYLNVHLFTHLIIHSIITILCVTDVLFNPNAHGNSSGILEFLQILVISISRKFLTFPKYILT